MRPTPMPAALGNGRPRLGDHGRMTTTAGTKPKRSKGPATVGPEIVFHAATPGGYSFIVLAEGRGALRRYWWHCGGCWLDCVDTPAADLETVQGEYALHIGLCPEQVNTAQVTILRYAPVPGCECRGVASA